MVDFAALRKNSGKSSLQDVSKQAEKLNKNAEYASDDRYWQPTVDKAGNGYAVIRFLPASGEETVPFIRMWQHGFKGTTGQWYIENSLTTISQPDPVSELNTKLWNETEDENSPQRKQARLQKRKLFFISNIYVVSDPSKPENNGTVRLYKYGKKVFDKINQAMKPAFDDEGRSPDNPAYDPVNAFNPFDLWAGANFRLKIRKVEDQRNYDTSDFDRVSPLFDNDEKLESVWKKEHLLQPLIATTNFKTYEELKKRLDTVLGVDSSSTVKKVASRKADIDDEIPWHEPKSQKTMKSPAIASVVDDDDADMEFFRKLNNS
jgi:hypothetical protein